MVRIAQAILPQLQHGEQDHLNELFLEGKIKCLGQSGFREISQEKMISVKSSTVDDCKIKLQNGKFLIKIEKDQTSSLNQAVAKCRRSADPR